MLGEGAGRLVLERAGHAEARGAAGYADVLGWGATNDAHHPTTPDPTARRGRECMRRAVWPTPAWRPADVGYLNAHGTSTKLGDVAEATRDPAVFGAGTPPPVSSTKGVTGHMLGASGVVEAAVGRRRRCARGLLPPTHNLDEPGPGVRPRPHP